MKDDIFHPEIEIPLFFKPFLVIFEAEDFYKTGTQEPFLSNFSLSVPLYDGRLTHSLLLLCSSFPTFQVGFS